MFSTLIVRSIAAATALIGIVGIPWAITLWAPFAIISAEVSKRDALRRSKKSAQTSREESDDDPYDIESTGIVPVEEDQAGVILGIHNMAIASPQILATLGSSIIFKFLQKPRGTPGDRSFAVALAAGGLFTLVAAFLTSRIKDEVELPEEIDVGRGRSNGIGESRRRSQSLVRSHSYTGLEY